MLSVLISVYNQDPASLVHGLLKQLKDSGQSYEIIIGNDGSGLEFVPLIKALENLSGVECIHTENIGRSRIRNLLAEKAKYQYLLFIDGDAEICNDRYILNYLKTAVPDAVVCGGTAYNSERPEKREEYLRWKYGVNREAVPAMVRSAKPYMNFSSFNFLIPSAVFKMIRFNETIMQYGHEDTLLGIELRINKIRIIHIDNQLIHNGLDSSKIFLEKTRDSLLSLSGLYGNYDNPGILTEHVRLLRKYDQMKKRKLLWLISALSSGTGKIMRRNLMGRNPSLLVLDLYKLCILNEIHA